MHLKGSGNKMVFGFIHNSGRRPENPRGLTVVSANIGEQSVCTSWNTAVVEQIQPDRLIARCLINVLYKVHILSFRTDCAEQIRRAPSGGHPQKHVGASLDTLCA
jgi:hypothetical protein